MTDHKPMKNKYKLLEWKHFISGAGYDKLRDAIEIMKQVLYKRYFYKNKTPQNLIFAIRMEHLQMKKHSKLCMRYLQELEEKFHD